MATRVFVSHSSTDKALAGRFVRAIEAAMPFQRGQIRCTSLPRYSLRVGSRVSPKLRQEIEASEVIVALITPNSLQSSYVLFELGAAWGREKTVFPLLAKGARTSSVPELLKALNAVKISDPDQLAETLQDLAKELGLELKDKDTPVYREAIAWLLRLAGKPRSKRTAE